MQLNDIFGGHGPLQQAYAFHRKMHIQFQGIHRPLEAPHGIPVGEFNNPEKKPLPMSLWTLLIYRNVDANKIKCNTRTV